jgi:DNA polymerase IV
MSLRYLFIDFDSFFASVEQQFRPELRGRPVGIVPSIGVETTCCIAASYEAKAHGVKTGTPVREARYLCPGIQFIQADNRRYIQTHQKIKACIHSILYIDAVLSIDEMYGRLPPQWQAPEIAHNKADEIKRALAQQIGPYITGSIGLAPNRFLAKMASKLRKPNGLVEIDFHHLPEALYPFKLRDITGIGSRIQQRLRTARILDMEDLCVAPRHKLHRVWGSVEGDRMWYSLRGIEIPATKTQPSTIGHSHVLPPRLRSIQAAHATLHRMLQKACRRLRAMQHFTGALNLQLKFGFEPNAYWDLGLRTFPTQDNIQLAEMLNTLWQQRPRDTAAPVKVAITLSRLIHRDSHTESLFAAPNQHRRQKLQTTMDQINQNYGDRTLYYAPAMAAQRSHEASPMRIAFNHIPELDAQ